MSLPHSLEDKAPELVLQVRYRDAFGEELPDQRALDGRIARALPQLLQRALDRGTPLTQAELGNPEEDVPVGTLR